MRFSIKPPRCPFCHDALAPGDVRLACNTCMAWHHQGCWREGAMRCATCRSPETGLAPPRRILEAAPGSRSASRREERRRAPQAAQALRRSRWRVLTLLCASVLLGLAVCCVDWTEPGDSPGPWTDLVTTVGIVSATLGLVALSTWLVSAPWQWLSDRLSERCSAWIAWLLALEPELDPALGEQRSAEPLAQGQREEAPGLGARPESSPASFRGSGTRTSFRGSGARIST